MTRFLQITRVNHDKRVQYGDIKNVTRGARQNCCESSTRMLLGNKSNESPTKPK